MNVTIVKHEAAMADLDGIVAYLHKNFGINRANDFLEEVEKTIIHLANMPGMGNKCLGHKYEFQALRFFPLRRFYKYLIFYQPISNGIEVIRVFHGARDIINMMKD